MNRTYAGRALLTLALGALFAPATLAEVDEPTAKKNPEAREHHESVVVFKIVSPEGTLTIKGENGQREVLLNGEKIDVSRITWGSEQGVLRIYNDGEVVYEANLDAPPRFLRFDDDSGQRHRAAHAHNHSEHAEDHNRNNEDEHAEGRAPRRAMLGVAPTPIGPVLASQLDLEPGRAVVVGQVIPGSAADKAGLKRFDVILAIDGESPITPNRLRGIIARKKPGDTVELEIIRAGQRRSLNVELGSARSRASDDNDEIERWMRRFSQRVPDDLMKELRERGVFDSIEKFRDEGWRQRFQERFQEDWSEEIEKLRKRFENFEFDFNLDPDDLPKIELFRDKDDGVLFFGRAHKHPDERRGESGEDADRRSMRREMMERMPMMRQRMQGHRERMQSRLGEIEERLDRLERILRRLERRLGDDDQPARGAAAHT